MTQQPIDYQQWLAANDRYLADYLSWIRGRLMALAADSPNPAPAPAARDRRRRSPAAPSTPTETGATLNPPVEPLPPTVTAADDLEIAPALVQLTRRLGMSLFDRNILMLCIAMELDTRIASLCACAHRDSHRAFPTFALAMTLFDDPNWEAMSPEHPLRYWQLVAIHQHGEEPVTMSALRIDERVANFVKGLNHIDDRLRGFTVPARRATDADLAPSQSRVCAQLISEIERAVRDGDPAVIQLVGSDSASKRLVAASAADQVGLRMFEMPAEALPADGSAFEQLTRLWQRETLLSGAVLYLDGSGIEKGSTSAASLRKWLSYGAGWTFCDVDDPWPTDPAGSATVDVARPSPVEQRDAWSAELAAAAAVTDAEVLANHFNFNLPIIRRIAAEATRDATDAYARAWDACREQSRPSLERLAQRIEPKATWDDIKLPDAEQGLLRQIADQVSHRGAVYDRYGFRARMNRGLGISVLFTGESGTGKTMAAEVMANELGLLLYRIDLSAVVSKYIGETEKNLRRLFDAADSGGAILFFDEADALFGKRSEVKDSHDRYANIEINYLLQRMESYQGLAILATNMKSAMDSAFLRRLRFVVKFPFPAAGERRAIWEQAFPMKTPRAALDFDGLAALSLTGGSIANIAINAAFLAARDGGVVTMPMILTAARTEYRKLDRPFNEADFRRIARTGDRT